MQVSAHDRADFAAAWPHACARIEEASARGAKLIVLPEGTVPGYVLGREPVDPALLAGAHADVARIARRARAVVVYGGAKIAGDRTYNAAIAIGPGGEDLGFAAKQFLWHFDRRWYAAGETLAPIATPLGMLGLLVCADGRIPTIAATLVDRGAEMLAMPTAWVTSGRDPRALENVQADYMAAVRARENGVPFVVANKVGVERASVAYCGKSAIYAADGATLARGDETRDELVVGTILVGASGPPARRAFEVETSAADASDAARPTRVRVAFTPRTAPGDLAALADCAADADADLLLAPTARERATTHEGSRVPIACVPAVDGVHDLGPLRIASVTSATLRSPRALVGARLAGIDAFVWYADGEPDWQLAFARTRAAELRAYVVVVADERRAYVVDPDGITIAGTFAEYALASFVYDRTRTRATTVAPSTDVIAGLRVAEAIAL